jgi:putative tricarboxylic transport membrane protein
MELLEHLRLGFDVAFTPINFFYCLVGAFLGTLVGVLPGIGPVTTIAMLLPFTFKMPAVASLIMLAGIYYGAHHAGSTTAIMLNMPGEPSSIVICFDGHPMARQGRAGVALFISAVGSFFAGCVGVVIIATLAPFLSESSLLIGPPEYASMIIMALVSSAIVVSKSPLTTIAMSALGVLIGTVGTDVSTGSWRFTFGSHYLTDGVSFVAVATGLFAFAEVLDHIAKPTARAELTTKINSLIPSREDLRTAWKPILRGTGLGAIFGILPGTGPLVCSFVSYAVEKQLADDPSRFGKGAIEGVAAPEASNNAAAITHFIPMLGLGIPAGAAMALMLGALMIQGITPGPQVMTGHPDLFWGVVASMLIGNVMLLVLNLPMVGLWIRLLKVPYRLLYPAILLFCCIGVYSVNSQVFDIFLAAGFGALGLVFKRLDCPPGPLVLGMILGPALEENIRRALLMSRGNASIFLTSPISLAMLLLAVAFIVVFARPKKIIKTPVEIDAAARAESDAALS